MVLVDYDAATASNDSKTFDIKSNEPSMIENQLSTCAELDSDEKQLSELDVKILAVLANKKIKNYDKIKIYNELLRRYMLTRNDVVRKRKRESDEAIERISEAVAKKTKKHDVVKAVTSTPQVEVVEAYQGIDPRALDKSRVSMLTRMFDKYATIDDDHDITPIMRAPKTKARTSSSASYIKSRKSLYQYSPDSEVDDVSSDEELGATFTKKNKAFAHSFIEDDLSNITPPPQLLFTTPAQVHPSTPLTAGDVIRAWQPILRSRITKRT